jgi:hypothetical protein
MANKTKKAGIKGIEVYIKGSAPEGEDAHPRLQGDA